MLSMFKETDQEMANSSLNEYDLNMMQGAIAMAKGDFKAVAQYHRNIANACDDLEALKNQKQTLDAAVEVYKQIQQQEADRGQKV